MKYTITVFLFVLMTIGANAQLAISGNFKKGGSSTGSIVVSPILNPVVAPFDFPKDHSTGLRRVGKVLTYSGCGVLIIGLTIMVSSAHHNGFDNDEKNIAEGVGGAVGLVGLGMATTGVILWSKSSKKRGHAQAGQKLYINTRGAGANLTLRF